MVFGAFSGGVARGVAWASRSICGVRPVYMGREWTSVRVVFAGYGRCMGGECVVFAVWAAYGGRAYRPLCVNDAESVSKSCARRAT